MNSYFVTGFYGSNKTPCFVNVCEVGDGTRWYAADGSININLTYDEISDGVNIEELSDVDCMTNGEPINRCRLYD